MVRFEEKTRHAEGGTRQDSTPRIARTGSIPRFLPMPRLLLCPLTAKLTAKPFEGSHVISACDTHSRSHLHSRMSLSLFAETYFKTLKIARAFLAGPRCCHRGR